jgi:hypothetical protein
MKKILKKPLLTGGAFLKQDFGNAQPTVGIIGDENY